MSASKERMFKSLTTDGKNGKSVFSSDSMQTPFLSGEKNSSDLESGRFSTPPRGTAAGISSDAKDSSFTGSPLSSFINTIVSAVQGEGDKTRKTVENEGITTRGVVTDESTRLSEQMTESGHKMKELLGVVNNISSDVNKIVPEIKKSTGEVKEAIKNSGEDVKNTVHTAERNIVQQIVSSEWLCRCGLFFGGAALATIGIMLAIYVPGGEITTLSPSP